MALVSLLHAFVQELAITLHLAILRFDNPQQKGFWKSLWGKKRKCWLFSVYPIALHPFKEKSIQSNYIKSIICEMLLVSTHKILSLVKR